VALPDYPNLKAYLRLEDDTEMDLVMDLNAAAVGFTETFLGRVILDTVPPRNFGAVRAAWPVVSGLRVTDAAPNANITQIVTECDGREANIPLPTSVTGAPPLSTLPDYSQRIEPLLRQVIRDLVADAYEHRNSLVSVQSAGGGASMAFGRQVHGLPPRVRAMLKTLKQLTLVSP
jgi:hypothetical protein